MAAAGPVHDLKAVQRLVAATPQRVSYRDEFTVEVVADLDDLDPEPAKAFIRAALCCLTEADYVHTLTAQAPPADVYGWRDGRGRGWYVKFAQLANGRLRVISFHPPAAPLRTRTGVITR